MWELCRSKQDIRQDVPAAMSGHFAGRTPAKTHTGTESLGKGGPTHTKATLRYHKRPKRTLRGAVGPKWPHWGSQAPFGRLQSQRE